MKLLEGYWVKYRESCKSWKYLNLHSVVFRMGRWHEWFLRLDVCLIRRVTVCREYFPVPYSCLRMHAPPTIVWKILLNFYQYMNGFSGLDFHFDIFSAISTFFPRFPHVFKWPQYYLRWDMEWPSNIFHSDQFLICYFFKHSWPVKFSLPIPMPSNYPFTSNCSQSKEKCPNSAIFCLNKFTHP